MSRAMSLKAKIRNIAKQKNIPAQVILQNLPEFPVGRTRGTLRKRSKADPGRFCSCCRRDQMGGAFM